MLNWVGLNCKYLLGNFSYVYITVVKLRCLKVKNLFKLRYRLKNSKYFLSNLQSKLAKGNMLYTET